MIYFIRAGQDGLIKIGCAINPEKRRKELQTGSSAPLSLLNSWEGGRKLEGRIHQRFAHLRADGEWFRPGDDLLAFIADRSTQSDLVDRPPPDYPVHARPLSLEDYDYFPDALLNDPNITAPEIMVYGSVKRFVKRDGSGQCTATVAEIGRKARMGERHTRRMLKKLVAGGHLREEPAPGFRVGRAIVVAMMETLADMEQAR